LHGLLCATGDGFRSPLRAPSLCVFFCLDFDLPFFFFFLFVQLLGVFHLLIY
jgi:hypothetical protein